MLLGARALLVVHEGDAVRLERGVRLGKAHAALAHERDELQVADGE